MLSKTAQFVLVFNLCFILLNLGLGSASTYFLASGRASARQVLRINAWLLLMAAVLLASLGWVADGPAGLWLSPKFLAYEVPVHPLPDLPYRFR